MTDTAYDAVRVTDTLRDGSPATVAASIRQRNRRPASPQETARRKAWGKEWGRVGAEWKAANNPKRG